MNIAKLAGYPRRLLGSLFLLIERIKGEKEFIEIKSPHQALGFLVGRNVMGYAISIYCQKIKYRNTYKSRLVPDHHYKLYRVFSTVTSQAPEELIKACELDIPIPALLPFFFTDAEQRDAAIDAYVAMLIQEVQNNRRRLQCENAA